MHLIKEIFIKRGLIWPSIYVVYIIISGQLLLYFRLTGRMFNMLPNIMAVVLMPLIFGILLRLPSLIERWSSTNQFNWSKFIYQGIPALIMILMSFPISGFFLPHYNNFIPIAVQRLFWYETRVIYIAAVWLGVVVIDAIKGSQKT